MMKYISSIIVCVALLLGNVAKAQMYDKRPTYDHVGKLLLEGKWFEAKSIANKNIAFTPDDLAFQLSLALGAEIQIKSIPLFKWADISAAYTESMDAYKKVLDIKNGQVTEAKPFFAKIIGEEKPSGKDVVAFCEQKIKELEVYFAELEKHEKEALAAEKAYMNSLDKFSALVKSYNYADNLPIYIKSEDLTVLAEVRMEFNKAKALIDALEAGMASDELPLTEENRIRIKWNEAQVSGRNVSPVSENDFLRKEVTVYNLATWADKVEAQGKAINDLREALYEHIKVLDNGDRAPFSLKEYEQKAKEIATWHAEMTKYDNNHYLTYLTKYYLDKAKFFALEDDYQRRREQSFLHKDIRSALIQAIYQQIDSAYNSLRFIDNKKIYMPNQEPVLAKMGGVDQLQKIKEQEDSLWHAEKSHWSGVAFAAHSLRDEIPDELSFEGMTLVTRPAKGDVASTQASGKYTLDEIESLADATTLLYGRGKNGAIVAKTLLDGSVQWATSYPGSKIVYTADYHEGAAVYIVQESSGKMKVYLRDSSGEISIVAPIGFVPQKRFKTSDGLFLMSHANDKLQVMSLTLTDNTYEEKEAILKGTVAKFFTKENTLYLGINYQSGSDLSGQPLAGKQASNIAVGVFALGTKTEGTQIAPNRIRTFAMDKPAVLVQLIDTGNGISIKGLTGNYRLSEYGSYIDGDAWEQALE